MYKINKYNTQKIDLFGNEDNQITYTIFNDDRCFECSYEKDAEWLCNFLNKNNIQKNERKICPQCRENELDEYQTVCSACEFDERS